MLTTNIVKVGRREFDYDTFINEVKQAKTYSELCKALGMNATVQTTINTLKEIVSDLGLNTDHFTYKYVVTEKVLQSAQNNTKQFNLVGVNKLYYEAYEKSFKGRLTSWQQYKVSNGAYLESLGGKDFASRSPEEIEEYINGKDISEKTKSNHRAHIRSMMTYLVKNHIQGAYDKVSKKMLVYLV